MYVVFEAAIRAHFGFGPPKALKASSSAHPGFMSALKKKVKNITMSAPKDINDDRLGVFPPPYSPLPSPSPLLPSFSFTPLFSSLPFSPTLLQLYTYIPFQVTSTPYNCEQYNRFGVRFFFIIIIYPTFCPVFVRFLLGFCEGFFFCSSSFLLISIISMLPCMVMAECLFLAATRTRTTRWLNTPGVGKEKIV